jgi:multidrug efflux pump subunit AcrA (membrane-fusion protein)
MSSELRRAVFLLIAAAAAVSTGLGADGDDRPLVLTASLRAAEAERFSVPVTQNWQLTLTWLLPEGERVEPGDSIALLDPAGVQDQLTETEEELITQRMERSSQKAQASLAKMDLELALKRAEVEYRKAKLDAAVPQDVLKGVDYRQRQLEMAKKKQAFEQAQIDLLNHDVTTRAKLAEVDVEIAELESDYERLEKEIESLDLRATRPGIVVHAEHPWLGRKVLEGDRLQATFPVARIPDLDTLEVEGWSGESDAVRLAPGQRVTMRLDAYPERLFAGTVRSVSAAGERRSSWGRAPFFRVLISLDERDTSIMKPGMSVRCEVDTAGQVSANAARASAGSPREGGES